MDTIFRDKFAFNFVEKPVPSNEKITDKILQDILTHIQSIKDRQIEGDQILQNQWFMADVSLNASSKDSGDEWREETIFNSIQALFYIATEKFYINNEIRMKEFFKVIFQE